MRPFEFVRARDLDDALARLTQPGARVLAGGTTLVDLMKLGVETPATLIEIGALPLSGISVEGNVLMIGALASNSDAAAHHDVVRCAPAVAEALLSGASGQIRNAATTGGNLLQRTRCTYFRSTDWPCNKRDPGSGCAAFGGVNAGHAVLGISQACMAVHPSDLAVALVAVDAHVHLSSATGERRVALDAFYRLPDASPHIETVIAPDELITKIEIPLTNLNAASRYLKLRGRASYEFASASVASAVICEGNVVVEVAVALGGLGAIPWRNRDAEELLIGQELSEETASAFCNAFLSPAVTTRSNAHKLALARGAIHRSLQLSSTC